MIGIVVADFINTKYKSGCFVGDENLDFTGVCSVSSLTKDILRFSKMILEPDKNELVLTSSEKSMMEHYGSHSNQKTENYYTRYIRNKKKYLFDANVLEELKSSSYAYTALMMFPIMHLEGESISLKLIEQYMGRCSTGNYMKYRVGLTYMECLQLAKNFAVKEEIKGLFYGKYKGILNSTSECFSDHEKNELEKFDKAMAVFLSSSSYMGAMLSSLEQFGDDLESISLASCIAEAYYGLPMIVENAVYSYLDNNNDANAELFIRVTKYANTRGQYQLLTKYIAKFRHMKNEFVWNTEDEEKRNDSREWPLINHIKVVKGFMSEVDTLIVQKESLSSDEDLYKFKKIIYIYKEQLKKGVVTLRMNPLIKELKHLKDIDTKGYSKECCCIWLKVGGFFGGFTKYQIDFSELDSFLRIRKWKAEEEVILLDSNECKTIKEKIAALNIDYWDHKYNNYLVCDGTQWGMGIEFVDGRKVKSSGSNAFPIEWDSLYELFKK